MRELKKSAKLDNVCYDIRGPVMEEAKKLEDEGYQVIKLNIGNPAPFHLEAPDEIIHDVIINLNQAQGYCDSKGIFAGRKAIMQNCQEKGIPGVGIEDIYIGNGVSELIVMVMQGLLDNGDEILIPAPDYPLWTAAVNLSGGKAVHYICDEQSDWTPDLEDIKKKISKKTKGIVVINPNNPTGANYPQDILEGIVKLAAEHDLIVFADEIYDKILYDDEKHVSLATLSDDVLFLTFSGLSKSHRIAGFRVGWMIISGNKSGAKDYIEGINILSTMRLCSNVPAQYAIQTALGGYQSIKDLTKPGGRLREQRDYVFSRINQIPGLSCTKPKGAFYCFPKVDVKRFNIRDDQRFVLDYLLQEKVLLVQGTGFNWPEPDHFRLVFLPYVEEIKNALDRLERFLGGYQQR
ncbi:MAG TPA: pyridoxal phosphate-dependent aminotransferase [Bacillota bacterium]|nr:pyridoxal phosphate-dependent aminotransferase [Bacillota bacterium]